MNQYDCVCVNPTEQAMKYNTAPPPMDRPVPPPMPEQLRYVAAQIATMMDASNKLSNFLIAQTIPYDKREDDSVSGYLAWMARTIQTLNDCLQRMNDIAR